jgi:CspA family cold shock protein
MQYGYVKMWDATKGFGFIVTEDEDELFVHANDLDASIKGKRLKAGQKVAFDIRQEFKGDKAVNVRIVR